MGDRFLRHVERTKLLLHLVDVSSLSGRDPVSDYETINRELAAYDAHLATRPQIVVATKMDALDEPERLGEIESARRSRTRRPFYAISSATRARACKRVGRTASGATRLMRLKRSAADRRNE